MSNKVFIVAPSNTMADLPLDLKKVGIKRLESLGFKPVFGEYVNHRHLHVSGTVTQRLDDLKKAFADPEVSGIMAVFGGYNTNDLLSHIHELQTSTPKWIIGYSDITALLLALENHQHLNVIHGPGFASFCDPNFFDFSLKSFLAAIEHKEISYKSPGFFASDQWYLKENFGPREVIQTAEWKVYQAGEVTAPIIGGNIDTLCALLGTPYFPDIKKKILFVESTTGSPGPFQRALMQLRQAGVFEQITGLIIGMAPKSSQLSDIDYLFELLKALELPKYPVLLNVHCSHVDPMLSIPLNATSKLSVNDSPGLVINYKGMKG